MSNPYRTNVETSAPDLCRSIVRINTKTPPGHSVGSQYIIEFLDELRPCNKWDDRLGKSVPGTEIITAKYKVIQFLNNQIVQGMINVSSSNIDDRYIPRSDISSIIVNHLPK